MRYSNPVLSCKTSSFLAPQVSKREALIERSKKPSRSELGPVGKKRRRELERGRRRKERRLWVWVWRKGGGGFGRDGEVKRRERVLGIGLKKSGPNMGFESESESVRRSGGLKTDDIGKRDFQSDESSIFSLVQAAGLLLLVGFCFCFYFCFHSTYSLQEKTFYHFSVLRQPINSCHVDSQPLQTQRTKKENQCFHCFLHHRHTDRRSRKSSRRAVLCLPKPPPHHTPKLTAIEVAGAVRGAWKHTGAAVSHDPKVCFS